MFHFSLNLFYDLFNDCFLITFHSMFLFLDVPLRFPAPPVIGKIYFVIRKGFHLPDALANF